MFRAVVGLVDGVDADNVVRVGHLLELAMVDTPRDGKAWSDTVNEPMPWNACYVRAHMDVVSGYRYSRLTPTQARRRAEALVHGGGIGASVYQYRGGKMELVGELSRGVWTWLGAWNDPNCGERQDDPYEPLRFPVAGIVH